MPRRQYEKLLLRPEDVPASRSDFDVIGVFNPGAATVENEVVLLARVVEKPHERREGFTGLPRWTKDGELTVDWIANEKLDLSDPRLARFKDTGLVRLPFISHLRVIRCGDGSMVGAVGKEAFFPHGELEEYGIEDARLTHIGDRFYFTYVAVSRHGVATALASTPDFRTFIRHGIIFCPENKDVALFPERVGGDYWCLHRPVGAMRFARPEMWLARSSDLLHWGGHEFLMAGVADWESNRIGAGPPPVRIDAGWLVLYHGNGGVAAGEIGPYSIGAVLLDAEHPNRILGRTPACILAPRAQFERQGFVPNVLFPTGIVERGKTLLVYYGAADTCTGVIEVDVNNVLSSLQREQWS